MAKKMIDIGTLSEAEQKKLKAQLDAKKVAADAEEARQAEKRLEFYYQVKDVIEKELLKNLAKMPDGQVSPLALKARKHPKTGKDGWALSKILKRVANLPSRKPTTDTGFINAVKYCEVGKPRRLTEEQRDKKKAKAAAAAEAKKLETARKAMFRKERSDRKTAKLKKDAATSKKSPSSTPKPKPKSK